jgi:hypothetical protein
MRALVLAVGCTALLAFAGAPLTMAELKGLATDDAWPEVLARAQDVAPAGRTAEWKSLVRDAALKSLKPTKAVGHPFADAERADALAARFPFLATDADFDAARGDVVARGIDDCLHEGEGAKCWALEARYEKGLAGAAALKAAHAFVVFGSVKYRPMGLFAAAVTTKDAATCADSDLAVAVVAALDLPGEHEAAKSALKVAFEQCWTALAPALKTSLRGASDTRLKNICKPMRAKKALSELQDGLCSDVGE